MGESAPIVSRAKHDTLVIRICLIIVIVGLVVSGITAFPCAKS